MNVCTLEGGGVRVKMFLRSGKTEPRNEIRSTVVGDVYSEECFLERLLPGEGAPLIRPSELHQGLTQVKPKTSPSLAV